MKKQRLFFPVFWITLSVSLSAQHIDHTWTSQALGSHIDIPLDLCIDNDGNILTAGVFSSEQLVIGGDSLMNARGAMHTDDAFFAKYDEGGNLLWAGRAGGPDVDAARCIASDKEGNIFVAGVFYSPSITFGSSTLFRSGISNTVPDVFLAKYDAFGNPLWARKAGSVSLDYVNGLCTDTAGNVFMTGYFRGKNIKFGTTTVLNSDTLYKDDAFLVKYDPAGNVLWAKKFGGKSFDYGNDIYCDEAGNVLLAGAFSGSMLIGSDTLTADGRDAFLAKYTSSGSLLWVKTAGGSNDQQAEKVSLDSSGNIFLSGIFKGPVIYIEWDSLVNQAQNFEDVFLIKYDSSGNFFWSKQAGGIGHDLVKALCTDADGNVSLAGSFGSPNLIVQSEHLDNNSAPSEDAYLITFDPDGTLIWKGSTNQPGEENLMGIASGNSGEIILSGYFTGDTFTGGSLYENTGSPGTADMFLTQTGQLTGLSEKLQEVKEIFLFPNPSDGHFVVHTSISFRKLIILDIVGRTVLEREDGLNDVIQLDLTGHPAGMYFVRLISEKETLVKKVSIR